MLKCIVIDDEPLAIELLSDYIRKTEALDLEQTFSNPIEALHFVQENPVDLIFLDIQMPELTGIQFMKIIKDKAKVILTTAYEEYALEGYEFDVIDYLLKPISLDRFLLAVEKVKQRLQPPAMPAVQIHANDTTDYLFVKSSYKTLKVNHSDILYIEGLGDYVRIHTNSERIMTLENMRHFEEILPAHRFMRIHRSFLIALEQIEYIERNRVVINGQYLPVSASYQKAFWKRIGGAS